jgi:hypothetical protein
MPAGGQQQAGGRRRRTELGESSLSRSSIFLLMPLYDIFSIHGKGKSRL